MRFTQTISFMLFFLLCNCYSFAASSHSQTQIINLPLNTAPMPVQVKVVVANANWVQTISICNISNTPIPLTNIEFDFNYSVPMPSNLWGQPWAAWKLTSQNGSAVVLTGGTPYTPALAPDPNCNAPLTIQFNASPSTPLPQAPFVFKAEGGQPSTAGNLNVNLGVAPASGLSTPTLTVKGSDGTTRQQTVNWGTTWQLTNLVPGNYTISATPVDNGTNYFAATNIEVTVQNQQTANQTITYSPVAMGNVTVTLVAAPATQEPITFTGAKYTINKTVNSGASLMLPADTYTVSSFVSGYTSSVMPNPITVPMQNAISVNYTPVQNTSMGPYTTSNGNIVDKNGNPVTFKGVAWFGFNTGNHMLHGLWQADFNAMLNQIKAVGFNAVRLPFQFDFVLNPAIKPSGITTTCGGTPCNANIPQDSALNAFQWIVKQFTDKGIYVLLDDHYEDNTYVTNQVQWIAGWQKIAQLFLTNPMVGYDLYNEPDSHNLTWEGNATGLAWGSGIHAAANAIYTIDPTKLLFVEGVGQGALESNWGDGFATDSAAVAAGISNPKNFFTQLAAKPYLNQVVISPHVYGPDGTNNQGPDHSNETQAWAAWSRLHGYLFNNFLNVNGTAQSGFCLAQGCHVYPIAVGEFGGKFDPADPYYTKDTATLINLATFLNRLGVGKAAQPSWFYWDWNPNSGNTGGILKDDWSTIDCNKVNYLKNYLGLSPAAGICA